ncbi:glycosyltransferase family 2 protein [Devosia sp. RR2S18]|uniref:glycosyltransferase family 2 protein n=1 Tax=Devosia rhizosphaerae TaxID=3049774 RepID=UPI00253F6797|nr:glycosyltransferase family 2 protein [Devosia sp. RR2S18]WIJ24040.1 glycosyltransferase family 2 protein [Devosia sp. RR2S18]
MTNPVTFSVVVPCYNEADGISAFWDRLVSVMGDLGAPWEAVFVNDGSRDATLDRLLALRSVHQNIKIIDFSRNFGKEAAITAGLDHAVGEACVVIDADLQHPPETIKLMVSLWRSGSEVVLGKRKDRSADSKLRTWFSNRFYSIATRIFEVPIPKDVGDFRLMDRKVVTAVGNMRENQRFMKGLFAWVGFKTVVVEFEVGVREHGTSSFNLWKLLNFAVDGITSFTTVPLRLWFYIGSAISAFSLIYGAAIAISALLFGNAVPGYPSLATLVAFIGGVQLIGIGVLGEYIGRVYREVKMRPIYIVRDCYEKKGQ